MLSFEQFVVAFILHTLFSLVGGVAGACGGNRPYDLCCLGVAPFSTNANVWGNICGYSPSSQSELVGGRCIQNPGSCPSGTIPTCCAGRFPGSSSQCGLGTNCGPPSSTPPTLPPIVQPQLPSGWVTDYPCSADTAARVLSNVVVQRIPTNSPSHCISTCASQGYIYAGVEYGDECHCGTGYKAWPAPQYIDAATRCDMRCPVQQQYTCGGSFAIQLYRGTPPTDQFPPGWGTVFPCAVDVPSRVIVDATTTTTDNNSPGKCAGHCAALGYTHAGVEYGSECHCGMGVKPDTEPALRSECDVPCAGNLNRAFTCGGSWRIQIYAANAA